MATTASTSTNVDERHAMYTAHNTTQLMAHLYATSTSTKSCIVDGVVMPELNETVGDGGDDDGETIPLPGEVYVDSVGTAKDKYGKTLNLLD